MKKNLLFPLKQLRLFCLLILSILSIMPSAFSQGNDSRGKDFWLMFNGNYGTPKITLFITSEVNTTGTVAVPGLGFSVPFTVTANTVTPVEIPGAAASHTNDVVDNKGVHVTSAQEVTVYGLNYIAFTTDAFLGLPTDVLGTSYIIASYGGIRTEFGIVGTQAGTTVTIIPAASAGARTVGVPYNITLNQGDVYELQGGGDQTGTIITSTKPVGVFGANQCANIPPGYAYCDHIVEMLPPTTSWGEKFVTVPLKSRTSGDTWRFIASENATIVKINGVAQAPINKGKFVEQILMGQSIIESDKPILAVQYANGSTYSGNPGDPFMMLVPPFEQFLPGYTVTTVDGYAVHYINVVAPNSIVGALTLDGAPVPAASFTPIGGTGFSGAQIEVKHGTHTLKGSLPFGVFMYGFNRDDSYGYPGGQSFAAIATIQSLVLTPETGTAQVGTEQCFEALVKDNNGVALNGVRVDFNITGANPGSSGFAFTEATGIAKFCYTGANTGVDNIVASVGTLTDASTFTWTPKVSTNEYYSKAAGDLHNVLTWGVNPDGSGANPTDFGAGKTFNLANRTTFYNMTANWTVEGLLKYTSGSQLVINGHTLSIVSLMGAGTVTGSATSSLVLAGNDAAAAPAINFTPGAGSTLKNLTINRTGAGATAAISSALNLIEVLTVTKGTFHTNHLLTLKSSAANTARVAPVGGAITGNVTVERYIPARRAWRLMNAPVGGTQTINAAWQEGVTTASPNPNPNPGYGTYITIGSVANGFDQNAGSTASILQYNNTTDAWGPLPNTNATTVGNKPFMLFVRGHRGIALPMFRWTAPTITTLRAKGPLKVGDQMFPVDATGFTAVPNPFASPVNFATITRNNVQNNFYLWDPKMGGTYGVGAYVNVSFNGTGYDVTPASVSPESQYIQSGQSFLVRSTGTAGSIVIKESDKSATPAMNVFRMNPGNAPVDNSMGIRINLQTIGDDNTTSLLDEVYSSYSDKYRTEVDGLDAIKLENIQENLSIIRQGQDLMVDRRTPVINGDTLQLKLWNTVNRTYILEFNPVNLSTNTMYAALEDRYLKTITPVDLNEISQVYFNISDDRASASSDRFRVIISSSPIALQMQPQQGKARFSVYPNPVTSGNINLQFFNGSKGTHRIELVNGMGQVIYRKEIQYPGGTSIQRLQLNRILSKGIYQLHVDGVDGKQTLQVYAK